MLARANNQVTPISRQNIPSLDQAISAHENNGGHLTPESCYGQDPIIDLPGLQLLRERDFLYEYPNMDAVFQNVLHDNGTIFRQAILFFIELTNRYSTLLA